MLPAGILNIEGDFNRGDIISIKSKLVSTFAWGISNYSSNDIKLIKGKDSKSRLLYSKSKVSTWTYGNTGTTSW